MSNPSKIPATAPGPPCTPSWTGRLPLMNMSMQEDTNFFRDASLAATSEKYFEYVQPPKLMLATAGFTACAVTQSTPPSTDAVVPPPMQLSARTETSRI